MPAERPVEPPPPFGAQVLELNLTEAQRIEPKFHLPVTGAGMILSRCGSAAHHLRGGVAGCSRSSSK